MAKYELSLTVENANLEVTPEGPVTLSVLELVGPRGETGPTGPQGAPGTTDFTDLENLDGADTATAGQLLQADGDGTFSFTSVSGVSDDLDDVTSRGGTTTNDISVGALTATSLNTHTIPTGTGTLAKTSDIPTNNNQLTNGAGYITDYTVTEADVTTHQAALSITESQISDLGSYLTAESDTLDSVTDRGSSTTNGVTVGSLNTHTIPGGTGTLALTSDVPTNNNQLTNGAGYITDYTVTEGDVTAHQAALSITESQISDFGTYATLVGGTVPASQLPSYVDDVEEYTNYASFPASGETGKIYVDLATGDIYRWSGSAYVQINDAVSSADQATRLATARTISLGGDVSGSTSFDGSADVTITATVADDSHNHVISNVDGLQTALDGKLATTATTDDVSEGSTNLYYTDARATSNFNTNLASSDTDNLSEGTTNLYYTDTRARGAITLTSSNTNELSYNGSTGEFSYTSPSTVSQSTAVTLDVRNTTGSTIAKGVPVYIAGHSGNKVLVAPADANDPSKMPAIGLASSAINNNSDGTVTSFGLVAAIDTSSFSVGDTLYIDTTPGGTSFGGLTSSAPTGETSAIQNIGKIARSDNEQGEIIVSGPGRSNATPNLATGNIFIGDGNQAVTSSLNTEVSSIVDKTFVDALNVDADTLDGNDSAYYLNASNISTGTLASARLPDLAVSDFAAAAIVTEAEGLNSSDNDTSIPTTAAVKDYVDGTGSVANDATITIAAGTGLSNGGDFTTNQGTADTITINHSNSVTAGTVSEGGAARTLSYGGDFNVPSVTYDAQGHITGTTTTTLTLPASDNTDTLANDATITISAGTGLSDGGTFTTDQGSNGTITLNHTNSVTGATVSEGGVTRTLSYGDTFSVPTFTFDNQGHISGTGTAVTLTLPASDNTDTTYSAGDGLDLNGTTFSHTDTSTATSLTTLSGASVVSDIDVDTYGHVTAMATRSLTLADLGYTGSTSADNYASWIVSDGTNSEAIASGNTLTFADSGASSVSYDTSTNTLTVSSTDTNTTYSAGTGLGLSGTEFSLDFSELTDMTGAISGTTEFILQDSGTESRKAASEISLSAFDNSTSGFTTNTGTVTNVSGGNGLTGSVTSSGSLNVGAGNYIVVNADDIAVDATPAATGGKVVARDSNGDFQARNLTLSGDLTVNGSTTTLDTTNLTVEDRLIELATGTTGTPSNDSGIVIERGSSDNAFIGFDESEGRFTVGTGTFTGSSTGDLVITTGTLAADLVGDVTGTVSDVSNHNSDDITEGSTNLYTTAARTRGHFTYGTGITHDGSGGLSVTQADINTDNVTEGSSNLFTTAARTRGHFTYGTGIAHNAGELSLDFSELTDKTTDIAGTTEFILQDSGTESRKAANEIKLSAFNNDAGFTSNVGDITGVTAGTGLSGGGDSGSVTLNLDFSELTDMTGNISGTTEFILQNGTTESRKAANEITLSTFDNDSGFTTNTGTVTQVSGGSGLSGTVTSSGSLAVDLSDTAIFSDAGVSSRAVKTDANGEIQDGKGDVRDIPSSSTTGTLVAADAGKFVPITANIAIPASNTFSVGEAVTIYNNSTSDKDITSAVGVTAYLAGTATTGTRTLAQRGLATLLCVGTDTFVISGVGLT